MELAVNLDESLPIPLYRQLYEGIRLAILSRRIVPGQKLPSSRSLAKQLNLSRNTVTLAYAELQAEGYLVGRHGSGSYVSRELPDEALEGAVAKVELNSHLECRISFKDVPLWSEVAGTDNNKAKLTPPQGLPYDFHPGQGAWDFFPKEIWRRLLARQWKRRWREIMDYGDPAGYRPLREQVAAYLGRSRAVRCSPEDVVIVNGTQQALDLLSRILLKPGQPVAVENPGYIAARQVFSSYGARLVPIPVDEDGIVVERLRGSGARMVLVTPSHQFPTGAALSLSRRLNLLAWAQNEGGLVLEDDYDSEFRFQGRPLASLQGLDDSSSVVYLGSFSKVLFPSLRVGYAVLPSWLIEPFQRAKDLTDRQTPILEQQVLADLLGEGHFESHLRKMRQLYRARRQSLVDSLDRYLGNKAKVMGADAGMHVMISLETSMEEAEIVKKAADVGVAVYPAAAYYCGGSQGQALLMGYAGMNEEQIQEGIKRLANVLGTL